MAEIAVGLANVWKRFPGPGGETVTAVKDVSLRIPWHDCPHSIGCYDLWINNQPEVEPRPILLSLEKASAKLAPGLPREVTLPTIWPSIFGAFLISFILAFNNLEISFYNLGAIPTLPSVAWGSLRFGLGPELFAIAAMTNALVFAVFAAMYVLMRTGIVKFG